MTDPIFGEKMFTGVGYPTPVSIPEETSCLTLQVPANAEWWALAVGVLWTLSYDQNWQQFEGGMSREDAAARWIQMVNEAVDLAAETNSCDSMAEAPYWDDDDAQDADDTEETAMEDWYGEVTFSEDGVPIFNGNRLEDWLIAGLVALVSGKDKAVRFLVSARQFRIYLRAGDFGGTVKIFLNGILATLVDTYSTSPGLREVPILTDGTPLLGMGAMDDLIEMLIVQDDAHNPEDVPQLQIIRKRLWAGEIAPTNTRYNSECNCVEVTYDDGDTWHERPEADPRHGTIYLMPPLSGGDAQCAAAGGMVELVRRTVDNILNAVSLVEAVNAVFDLLALLTGGAGVIAAAVLTIVEAVLAIGSEIVNLAFSEDAYAALLCSFYCNIQSDGNVLPAQVAAIEEKITADTDIVVSTIVNLYIENLWGEVLLSNAGVSFADHDADCSACDCSSCNAVYDFTPGDQLTWYLAPTEFYSAFPVGAWVGDGWQTQASGIGTAFYVAFNCDDFAFDKITVEYDATGDGNFYAYIYNTTTNTQVSDLGSVGFTSGAGAQRQFTSLGVVVAGTYALVVGCSVTPGQSVTLHKVGINRNIP